MMTVVIRLEVADDYTSLLERRASKALDLLCGAVSSPAAQSSGLSEGDNINAIKKLRLSSLDEPDKPEYEDDESEVPEQPWYTPVWNISSKQELEQVGLDLKEIEGLAFILPFWESSHKTNVSDQLIPEILFTLEILDYDEDKFRRFTSRLDRYPAVGVLLCEILTDSKLLEKAQQFLGRESTDQKREILFEYLKGKLLNLNNLNIAQFASLCGQYIATIVPKEIDSISINNLDGTTLATIVSQSSVVKELRLSLDPNSLASFQDGLKNSDVKIQALDISHNENIDEEGFHCAGNIVKKHAVKELNMSVCGLSFGKLKSFDDSSGNAKIRSLHISYNHSMDEEGFRCLGNIVKKHGVEELNMSVCDLSFGKLKSFEKTSGNAKIRSLNISKNRDIDEEGFRCLGNIVKKHAVEELNMSTCGLSSGKLKSFNKTSGNAKIRSLDISWCDGIDEEGFHCLGNIVKKHAVEELELISCGLSLRKLKSFNDASENAKIRSLDISYNQGIDEKGFRCLGNIVKKHAVEELRMTGCHLSFGKLKSFDDASGNAKIRCLDISGNTLIYEESFRCLGNIVRKHAVEELDMSYCGVSIGKLKSFDDASGNAKIRSLDISGSDDINEARFDCSEESSEEGLEAVGEGLDEEGFCCLGNIVKKHAVEELNMSRCRLSFGKMKSFDDGSGNAKIKVLDISDNDDLTVNAICQLALKVTDRLITDSPWSGVWEEEDIRKLQDFIQSHHPGGLKVTLGGRLPELQFEAKRSSGMSETVVVEEDSHVDEDSRNVADEAPLKKHSAVKGWVKLSGNIFMHNETPLLSGAQVYKAELRHATGKTKDVVVKLLPKDEKHKKEIDILLELDDHPNIVKIIDSGDIPGLIPQLYVVMERCHQNLKQYVDDKKSQQLSVPIPKAKSFFKQMISAIVFIHGRKIIHLDLKPSNILISSDEASLKVADFGISREILEDRTQVTVTNSDSGTEGYKPPEAYQGATKIGYKADVFQMGVIGYYIFTTGQHPFGEDSNIQAVNIKKNKSPDVSGILQLPGQDARRKNQLTKLLVCMLAHVPAARPTAEQASKDEFFKDEDNPSTSASLDQMSSKPPSYIINVKGDLHVGGDINHGSTGRTEDYRSAAIQTLNKGHLETSKAKESSGISETVVVDEDSHDDRNVAGVAPLKNTSRSCDIL